MNVTEAVAVYFMDHVTDINAEILAHTWKF